MSTYVVLTRLTPEAMKTPGELKRLERVISDHVRRECPQVKWVANYAILGPYDYLDIFEAPDETVAAKVVMIIRSYGHGQTAPGRPCRGSGSRSCCPAEARV